MNWADIDERDRKVIVVSATLASLLLAGLVITGLWQLVIYKPQPEDIQLLDGKVYLVGRPVTPTSAHSLFADMAGILTVFALGWLSYHLLRRVSRAAIASLVVVVGAILGGSQLTVNDLALRDGALEGSTDVSAYEVVRIPEPLWTGVHAASVPVLLLIIWSSLRFRNAPKEEPKPRWNLDFD